MTHGAPTRSGSWEIVAGLFTIGITRAAQAGSLWEPSDRRYFLPESTTKGGQDAARLTDSQRKQEAA